MTDEHANRPLRFRTLTVHANGVITIYAYRRVLHPSGRSWTYYTHMWEFRNWTEAFYNMRPWGPLIVSISGFLRKFRED